MSSNNALVHVRCHNNGAINGKSSMVPLFPDFGNETFEPVGVANQTWMEWIETQASANRSGLLWVDLPQTREIRRTSLGAIAILPELASDGGMLLWACSIDARWANTEITSSSTRRQTEGQPWSFHINGSPLSSWLWQDYFPRIVIDSTYAQYLNPHSSDNSTTVFSQLCKMAGLSSLGTQPIIDSAPALEATLNLMIINGLVRLAPTVVVQGTIANWYSGQGPWWREFMPSSLRSLGWGGNAYNITDKQAEELFRAQMKVTAKGYAYVWNGSAIQASMTVLAIYVAIALLHICFSMGIGMTSSSWDSPCEVIALAANSRPPPGVLQNTGAGISKLSTLGQNICIEAIESTLQLSFGPEHVANDRKIKPNTAYG